MHKRPRQQASNLDLPSDVLRFALLFVVDSMDTLHFAMAISREFGFDVAEKDYLRLAGVAEACNYVREKLESGL